MVARPNKSVSNKNVNEWVDYFHSLKPFDIKKLKPSEYFKMQVAAKKYEAELLEQELQKIMVA
ncbi:MAG: hypothetical protein LBT91_03165 [Bifidobacteriaceae bacterium]|jgi:hypothetical protein|nr:hypothetical protein [Bifidobacteriaceae bacterium]